MSHEGDSTEVSPAKRKLLRQREKTAAELALKRTDRDTPCPDKALIDRVRELETQIETIDAELERLELAEEIERQSDA